MSASQVVSFPMPMSSSFPAGCCPPGGMDALMQCYCDIQAAKNFIGKIVLDLMQTDPAFATAMVQAIADSGAALPLVGVTNGTPAQPGQVGEFINIYVTAPYPVTANYAQAVTMGVLQPGDWDCAAYAYVDQAVTGMAYELSPAPPGVSNPMPGEFIVPAATVAGVVVTPLAQMLIAVPTLINFRVITNLGAAGPSAGNVTIVFMARRAR